MSLDPGAVHLTVTLMADDQTIANVLVTCRRPQAARLLLGKTPAEARHLTPLLFAVCGKAQGLAADLALRAAAGEAVAGHRDAAVAREGAREHLWHLLGTAQKERLASATRCLLAEDGGVALRTFLTDWLGADPATWLALETLEELDAWAVAGGLEWAADSAAGAVVEFAADAVPLLPNLDTAGSLRHWPRLDDDFAQTPRWQGRPAETGALARQAGQTLLSALVSHPFQARKAARLRELLAYALSASGTRLPGWASAHPVAAGRGRALVETARGLLMHEVAVAEGRIVDYVLVAPTEWNFHPAGSLASWLTGARATDRAGFQTVLEQAVAALDPCVPWSATFAGTA